MQMPIGGRRRHWTNKFVLICLQQHFEAMVFATRENFIQGFNENLSILAMLAAYAALVKADVPIEALIALLGLLVALVMSLLIVRERRFGRARASRQRNELWNASGDS